VGEWTAQHRFFFLKDTAFRKLISFGLKKNAQGSEGKKINFQNPAKTSKQPNLPPPKGSLILSLQSLMCC